MSATSGPLDLMRSPRVAKRKSNTQSTTALSFSSQEATKSSTDLFENALSGSLRGVRDALSRGGEPNYFHRPEDGKGSLHVACEGGHADIAGITRLKSTHALSLSYTYTLTLHLHCKYTHNRVAARSRRNHRWSVCVEQRLCFVPCVPQWPCRCCCSLTEMRCACQLY